MNPVTNEPFFTTEFGKEIAKTVVISAVTSAGMIAGIAAIGLIGGMVEKVKNNRKVKKSLVTN